MTTTRHKTFSFKSASGLTEEGTSKTMQVDGMNVHYHDIGKGEPILFLHAYGPGTTAWIMWHKVVDEFAKHYRCILYDMPNFAKTGPLAFEDSIHGVQARVGLHLLDALDIKQPVAWVGNSQGGQSALVAACKYPDRVKKFVLGGSHMASGGNTYLLANRPDEATYFTSLARNTPTEENVRLYLTKHIFDESQVTDELVDYIKYWHTWSPEFTEARNQTKNVAFDCRPYMRDMKAPALMVHGRFDRMVPFEVSIEMLSLMPNSRLVAFHQACHWTPFEKPREYVDHVLLFLLLDD